MKPEQMSYKTPEKEDMSWVQDIAKEKANEFIIKHNARIDVGRIKVPRGSRYELGPSKSGKENEVGIYFFNPTKRKEKE